MTRRPTQAVCRYGQGGRRSQRRFWPQPFGLARLFAHLCVVLLANIRDIGFVALLDLSENRDSASRVSVCYRLSMYFDVQLWRMTRGLRGRIVLAVVLGLFALAAGIARFAFLGWFLALIFQGASFSRLALPLAGVALAIVLRAALEHTRTMVAHRTAAR